MFLGTDSKNTNVFGVFGDGLKNTNVFGVLGTDSKNINSFRDEAKTLAPSLSHFKNFLPVYNLNNINSPIY